jgi:hypothetical protein
MRSVLLDTNLLVLLIVGMCNREYISTHKRTRNFVIEDFDLLLESINGFAQLHITSHCLAEVSNLIRQTHERQAQELMTFLSKFSAKIKESHISKELIFNKDISVSLGVTDTGIFIKSKRVTVFTVDLDLYLEILGAGHSVVNFNHLRNQRYLT